MPYHLTTETRPRHKEHVTEENEEKDMEKIFTPGVLAVLTHYEQTPEEDQELSQLQKEFMQQELEQDDSEVDQYPGIDQPGGIMIAENGSSD